MFPHVGENSYSSRSSQSWTVGKPYYTLFYKNKLYTNNKANYTWLIKWIFQEYVAAHTLLKLLFQVGIFISCSLFHVMLFSLIFDTYFKICYRYIYKPSCAFFKVFEWDTNTNRTTNNRGCIYMVILKKSIPFVIDQFLFLFKSYHLYICISV